MASTRVPLPAEAVDAVCGARGVEPRAEGLVRAYRFGDSPARLRSSRVGPIAEKRDHHPDIELGSKGARLLDHARRRRDHPARPDLAAASDAISDDGATRSL